MIEFEFILMFDLERDYFIVEISHDNVFLAEVTEHGEIHLYNETEKKEIIESSQFKDAIEYAKKRAKG
ncbi:MAG: hypothetical protein FWD39_01420 [Clostridiales bacterium]|nr:hypothetical protein [Clostridiales bacterium]